MFKYLSLALLMSAQGVIANAQVGPAAGALAGMDNAKEAAEKFEPATEITNALAIGQITEGSVLFNCASVPNQSFIIIARAGTNFVRQLRSDPTSPYHKCLSEFCKLEEPERSAVQPTYDKYCSE